MTGEFAFSNINIFTRHIFLFLRRDQAQPRPEIDFFEKAQKIETFKFLVKNRSPSRPSCLPLVGFKEHKPFISEEYVNKQHLTWLLDIINHILYNPNNYLVTIFNQVVKFCYMAYLENHRIITKVQTKFDDRNMQLIIYSVTPRYINQTVCAVAFNDYKGDFFSLQTTNNWKKCKGSYTIFHLKYQIAIQNI